MSRRLRAAPFFLALGACGCGGVEVDLDQVPAARASCEAPTMAQLRVDGTMLPGRNCQSCHIPGGQAAGYRLTISGTVFRNLTVPCNSGGVEGVRVEILDEAGRLQTALVSNAVGNFYTAEAVRFPVRVRISKGSVTREMLTSTVIGSCAACHQKEPKFGTEGQVYLNRG